MSAAAASPQPPQSNTPNLTTAPTPALDPTEHIHTYHCLCTQLLLASTTPLSSLPRRGGDADATATSPLDRAYILPLPAPPSSSNNDSTATTDQDQEEAGGEAAASPHYALTLSLTTDRNALIVQRDDGLEKRYLARCGRCRVVVGYWLDWSQFASSATSGAASGSGEVAGTKASGRRENVVYLLPGGLLSTRDMAAGKRSGEGVMGKGV